MTRSLLEKHKRYTAAKVSFQNTQFQVEELHWEHSDTLTNSYPGYEQWGKGQPLELWLIERT